MRAQPRCVCFSLGNVCAPSTPRQHAPSALVAAACPTPSGLPPPSLHTLNSAAVSPVLPCTPPHTHTHPTGLTPPYKHYEPALDGYEFDWRWAVGATPWGPYSNYSGVSELMQVRGGGGECVWGGGEGRGRGCRKKRQRRPGVGGWAVLVLGRQAHAL